MLKDSHLEGREILSTHYRYDKLNRLIQAHNAHSELRFGYDHNRLVKEQLIHLDEPLKSGISRSQPKDVVAQITEHRYDVLGNRIQTILPTGEVLNRLYYGSGHLHHINLDGSTLADIERDALHRPVERTIGKLNTQFQLDPLGRDLCKKAFPPTAEIQTQVFGCFCFKYPLILLKFPLNPPWIPNNQASGPPFRQQQAHLACWRLSKGSNTSPSDGFVHSL